MEEDLLFDIIDVLRELRFAVEPLANDISTTPSPTTTLALSSSSPTSRSLHSVNQLSNSLVQQSMLLEQFVRQLHELLYVVNNGGNDRNNNRRSIEKKGTLLMSSSETTSVAMQISPAVELLLIRKFGDVLEGAHGVRLLTEIMCNERPRRSSMGELSPSSNTNNNKGNMGNLNHASNEHIEVCEKGKLPRSLPPLSPKSASTTSLSSFTSLSCVQNKYDEQHTLETFQSLLQNIEDAMRLLRIAYPNIFASTRVCKSKVNTPLASISDNASNNNYNIEHNDNNVKNIKVESYTSSESDDGKRSVSSASLEELDPSAPTRFEIANHSNDNDYDDKNSSSSDSDTEERVSGKDDSESLMSTLNTHKAASPLLRSVTVPCRDASQEQIHTDSLDATINTVIERTSSNERWSGENSPVVHAMNANHSPETSIEQIATTTTKATSKQTTNSRQLQGELTMRSLSSKSLSSSSSSASVTTPTQELHTKQNTHIQEEEEEHKAKSENEQNNYGRRSEVTKRKSNSADLMDVGTPPLNSSPSSAKLVIGTDKKRSHSQSSNNHNVFYSITSRESESSPRMSVNTIPYCNRTPTQSTSLEASPLSEMTYNSNTKSYMSNSNVNSSRCVIGHDDLLNSPDIHAISFSTKIIPNSNSDNVNMNAKTREETAWCDVDILMSNLLSLEGNIHGTHVGHAHNNEIEKTESTNSSTHHHLEEEKEEKMQKDTNEPAQTVHGDINVHNHESYVSTAVSYTTTETSHSSNSVVAPLSFASSEEYVSCSSYPTQSVTLNANSTTSVFNSMEEKTQSGITSDKSHDDTAPFTSSKHDNAVHDNNDEDNKSEKERKEDNEEKIGNNVHQVSLMVAVGNNVNREESSHLAEINKNTNNDVEIEERELQHLLTTCREETVTSSTESKAEEATPSVLENQNQDKVDVEIEETKYVVTKHTHCISGTQWSCLLEGELYNLLVETFCLDIVDLFNYCGNNTSKRQFQLSDVRDVHFSIAGNYLYVLFALHHDVHLTETEINMRVSLCEYPALMALHDSAVVENEMSNANRKRASGMINNSVNEPVKKRNSDTIRKIDEHGVVIQHHHHDHDKDECKDLQTIAQNNTAENKIGVEKMHTKPKSEARCNSSTPHKRIGVQRQQKRVTPVNDLLRSIRKLGTRTRSTSTPPIEERRTNVLQTTLHGNRNKIIHKDSMSKNIESYNVPHTNEKESEHTSAMSVHEDDVATVNSESKRGRRKSSNSSENNDNSSDIITNIKDKSPEMPSPVRTIPQPTSFTSNSASLAHEQNNSNAITMKTTSSTKNKNKDNRLHTPCKSSTSSREASQNVPTHETRHLRHHTSSIAVPTSHNVYNESAMKVKAQHGMLETNVAHEEHIHDTNSTSASTLRSTDQPRRWCPVPEPRIQNNSSTSEEPEKVKIHHHRHLLRQSLERRRSELQESKNNTNIKIDDIESTNTVNEVVTAALSTVNEECANKQQSKVDKNTKSETSTVVPEHETIVNDVVLEEIEKDCEEQKNEVKHAKQLLESQSESEVQCNALQLPIENVKSTTSIKNNIISNDVDTRMCEVYNCTNNIVDAVTPSRDVKPAETALTLALQTNDKNKNLEESTRAKLTVDINTTTPLNAQNLNKLEEQEELKYNQRNMINNLDQHLLLTPKQLSTSSLSSSSSSSSPSPLPSPAPSPQLPSAYSRQYVCDATIITNKENNNNKLVLTEAELIMSAMERVLGFVVGDHPLQITRILTENTNVNTKNCNSQNNNNNVMRKSRRRSSNSEKLADTSILSEGNSNVSSINKISNKLKGISTINTAQNVPHTNELQLCRGDILRTVDGQVILSKLLLFKYMATRAQHNIHSVFLTVSRARGSHAMCRLSLEPLFASQTQLTEWADKLHEIAKEQEEQPLAIKKKEREKESIKKSSSNINNKTTANVNVEIIDNRKDSVASTEGNKNGSLSNTVNINNDYNNNDNESKNNTTVNEINAEPIRRSSISDSIHSLVNPSEMPTSSNRLLPQLLFDKGEIEPVSVISPLSLYTNSSFSTLVKNKTNNTKINSMAYNKKEYNKIDNKHQQKQEPQNTKAVPGLTSVMSTLELTSCSSLESAATTSSTAELQSKMSTKRTRLTSNPVISINQVTPFDKSTIHVPHITAKVRAPSKHIFVQR